MIMEEAIVQKSDKKSKKRIILPVFGLAMFLLGALTLVAIRFATLDGDGVHYHANFSLYINGQKDEFKSFTFYEEVQACAADDANNIKARTHLHDNNPGLVHVHAGGVTWGQFFTNLGYTLSNKAMVTDKGVFAEDQNGNKLTFILNGQPIQAIEGKLINTEDVLLINYGNDDSKTLQGRYDQIPRDATKANTQYDPATCSGGRNITFLERLKQATGIIDTSTPKH